MEERAEVERPVPSASVRQIARLMPAILPGRDMAVLITLMALLDISGLLHVYGLSSLYGEAFFFGLGALVVLLAFTLALWPSEPVKWLKEQTGIAGAATWVTLGSVLAALAIWQLLVAVDRATTAAGVPVTRPFSEQQKLVLFGLGGVGLIALSAAYVRKEPARRRWLTLAASGWFGVAVWSLMVRIGSLPGGEEWMAQFGGACACLLVVLALVALVFFVRPLSPGGFLGTALLLGGGVRLFAFSQLPININMNMGDMLPLVNAATGRMLQGHSPYYVYQMPYDLPLTYWPLNLLPYVPLRAWGLDLRLANLLFGLVVGGLLLWLRRSAARTTVYGRRSPTNPKSKIQNPKLVEPGWACYAFGALYLTPTMFTWDVVAAAPVFWLWLAVMMAVIVWNYVPDEARWLEEEPSLMERVRRVLPGAAMGASFAAGPLTLPFAPFLLVWWLGRGWRYAVKQMTAAVVVGAVFILPFLIWDRENFWLGAVSWFNDLGRLPTMQWQLDQSWLHEVGLAGQVWKAGHEEWLKPMQLIIMGGLMFVSWGRLRTPADVLRWGSATYILFMALNPVIWPYLFTPALLGLVFTLAGRGRDVAAAALVLASNIAESRTEVTPRPVEETPALSKV